MKFTDHRNDLHYPMCSSFQDGQIHDIWNGDAINNLKQSFFTHPKHLGLSLSTDGIPVFKSSQDSLWPVYLIINNLPPIVHMNKENMILCCIRFGPKPTCNEVFAPASDQHATIITCYRLYYEN